MANIKQRNKTTKNPFLDTLELTAENSSLIHPPNTPKLTKQTLLKSVKRKTFQDHYLPILAQLAEQEKNEYWRKRAWKVYHCAENLFIHEGEYKRQRCNLSECLICQAYKTKKRIDKYLPLLNTLKDPQFVTLTVPNVLAFELRETIRAMSAKHRAIRDVLRKQGYKPKGTRNLEVTFNPKKGDFHPHFHCVVEGKNVTEKMVYHWKRLWLKIGIELSNKAQDIRPFGSKESDILEVFKYASKIITEGKDVKERKIYSWGLYESIKATSGGQGGIRTFQSFGIKLSKQVDSKSPDKYSVDSSLPEGNYQFIFDKDSGFFDYVELASGQTLTDYTMPEKIRNLLNNIV